MPGKRSLRASQYYAHPRNLFWKIVGRILDFDPTSPYENRIARLVSADLALWDVLQSCTRESSLDSDIDSSTMVPNGFAAFFAGHPHIQRVCFNGARAESLFMRHVQPGLSVGLRIDYVRLPSTSPANASVSASEKERAWNAILI
jgi:TDG/mug DNA glycosylase family protein